jgi:hypothetical protein
MTTENRVKIVIDNRALAALIVLFGILIAAVVVLGIELYTCTHPEFLRIPDPLIEELKIL